MSRILFVDDDRFFGAPYVTALREHFAERIIIDVCTRIDDAVHYCHAQDKLTAIILDVMMPPPQIDDGNIGFLAEEGFATGIWFLRSLKSQLIERQIRVFVLTNRNFDEVRTLVAGLNFPQGLIECERKIAVSAAQLPNRVAGLLGRVVR